jgi:hypothetical protein
VIKSIAIVPATGPHVYSLHNRSAIQFLVPIAALGYAMSSSDRAKVLNEKLPDPSFRLGETFTNSVAERLRANGYEVTILTDVKRKPGSPDTLEQDLADVPTTADAVLHLSFYDVGVESPRGSTDYLPRLNVYTTTYVRQNSSYPYEATVYYGIDASEAKEYYIPHDPKHVYNDFDAIIKDPQALRSNLSSGAAAVGVRVAERVHLAFKPN